MRVIFSQKEIEEAIEKLLLDQVLVPDDMRIDIDLKATRGDEGYQAFIDILPIDAPADGTDRSVDQRIEPVEGSETLNIARKVLEAKAQDALPKRRGRPGGARNKDHATLLTPTNRAATGDVPASEISPPQAPQEIGMNADNSVDNSVEEIPAPVPGDELEVPVAGAHADQDPPGSSSTTETTVDPEPDPEPSSEALRTQEPYEEMSEDVVPDSPAVQAEQVPDPAPEPEPITRPVAEVVDRVVDKVDQASAEVSPEAQPDPEPEPVRKTRSLFANLSRPDHQGPNG